MVHSGQLSPSWPRSDQLVCMVVECSIVAVIVSGGSGCTSTAKSHWEEYCWTKRLMMRHPLQILLHSREKKRPVVFIFLFLLELLLLYYLCLVCDAVNNILWDAGWTMPARARALPGFDQFKNRNCPWEVKYYYTAYSTTLE